MRGLLTAEDTAMTTVQVSWHLPITSGKLLFERIEGEENISMCFHAVL
jgi:hypothetical protein